MGRNPPNPALALAGRTQQTCPSAPPISEPVPDCEQNVPAQCDLTSGVEPYPRQPGENLFCYYQRLFQILFTGGDTSAYLSRFNNLSDLTDAAAARVNLGLGSVLADIDALELLQIQQAIDLSILRTDVDGNTFDIGVLRNDVNALGTMSLQNATNVNITGGTISGITDLAVGDGGTGLSTVPTAGQILIGTGSGYSLSTLTAGPGISISNGAGSITISATGAGSSNVTVSETPPGSPNNGDLWWNSSVGSGGLYVYYVDVNSAQWVAAFGSGGSGGGSGVSAVTASGVLSSSGGSTPNITLTGVVSVANGGTGASTAINARANLGLGNVLTDVDDLRTDVNANTFDISVLRADVNGLGSMALQNSASVSISGGVITGITDLAVADGGTGASSAPAARSNLGLGSAATRADSFFLQTANNLSDLPSPSTARNNLGVASSSDVVLRANNLSDVSNPILARDNLGLGSMSTQDASNVAITGGTGVFDAANIGLLALTAELGYPTSGTIDLRFDVANNAFIALAGNATFTASGMTSGRILTLNLRNTTGATISLAWPSWNPTGTAFPSSLGPGESLCVRAEAYGTSVSQVYAQCVASSTALSGFVFNVRNYGATGDGVTNDGPAINAAIADLNLLGGALFFPKGSYAIATALTTITNHAAVYGEGAGVSNLSFQGAVGGLAFDFTSTGRKNASVQQLRFDTNTARTQTAIYYRQFNDSGLGQPFDFHSLEFGANWEYAINVDNLALNNNQGGNISNVFISGTSGPTSPECYGIRLAGCSNVTVYGAKIFNVNYGIVVEASPLCEGSWISDCIIVNCKYGVQANGANTWLTNIHANVSTSFGSGGAAFYVSANQCHVNDCYALGNDAAASALYVAGAQTRVSGLRALNTTGVRWAYGIYEASGTDNQYNSCSLFNVSTAVYLGGSYSIASNILFNDCIASTAIVDATGTNRISECLGGGSNVDNSWNKPYFVYSSWDPANLSPGQQDFLDITVSGAAFGMGAVLAPPYDLQNMIATAQVNGPNSVRITLTNTSNSSVDLGLGTWGVKLVR